MIKVYPERERGEAIRVGKMPALENVCAALRELGAREGLPIDVQVDEVKIGKGLSAMGAPQYPCVVVYNREHRKGYYCHVFAVEKHYNDEYVQMYLGDDSAAYRTVAMYESKHSRNFLENNLLAKAKRVLKDEHIYQERLMSLIVPAFQMAAQMPDRQAEEDARRRKAEEDARRRKAEEDARRRKAEEDARRRKAEEDARRRKAEEDARRRKAEEDARRRKAEEDARRRKAEEDAHRRKAEGDAQRRQVKKDAQQSCENAVHSGSFGLKEAYGGPSHAHREYLGGTKESCSAYRYHNGTMTWTVDAAGKGYKMFSCRKCGKMYKARKDSGCHRITCRDCGKLIEVTC